jgi:sugar phosphate isomerase/epimerase
MLDLCAAAGAKGVEVFHQDLADDPSMRALYKTLLADRGMTMPVIDVISNLVYADAAQKQQGIDGLRRGLDVCAEMGTGIAHVAGQRVVEGVSLGDARRMIADTLAAHVDMAAERGITIAFENFDPSPTLICSAADCLEILNRAGPGVKFVFDTGNFRAAGERSDENFDRLYDRICHFHFKDHQSDPTRPSGYRGCALGEGETPNPAIARELLRRGYSGWVALESLGDKPPRVRIPADMAVLKGWLNLGD